MEFLHVHLPPAQLQQQEWISRCLFALLGREYLQEVLFLPISMLLKLVTQAHEDEEEIGWSMGEGKVQRGVGQSSTHFE